MAKTIKVFVASISHRHGTDTVFARTKRALEKKVAGYCREWWDEWDNLTMLGKPPKNDAECIDAYFDIDHGAIGEWIEYSWGVI